MACVACGYAGKMNVYEVEAGRADDMMTVSVDCPACYKPLVVESVREEFKPSREQVEGWKAIGDRLIPKTERVTHTYENVNIEFASEGS